MNECTLYTRSRLDRSVELHANVFQEDDVDNAQVNEPHAPMPS